MYQNIVIKCEKDDDFVYESCSQGFEQESKGNYEENYKSIKIEINERITDNEALGCIVKVETIENHQFSLEDNKDDSIHLHGKPLTNHNNFNSGVLHSQRLNDSGSGEEKHNVVSSITKEEVDSCEDGEDETGLNKQILDFIHKIETEENDVDTKPLMNIHADNNSYSQGLNVLNNNDLTKFNTEVYHTNQCNEEIYNNANSNVHIVPKPKAATTKSLKPLCNKVTKYKKQSGRNTNKKHSPLNVNEGVYTDLNVDKQQSKVDRKIIIKCEKLDAEMDYATNIHNLKTEPENITHTDVSNLEIFKYSCDVCNFKTNIEKWMTHHTLLHNDKDVDSILVCDHCHYRTKVKQRLMEHMERHTLLPYSCEICGYKCKFLYNLINHTKTHTEKAFSCKVCDSRFSWPNDLAKHMRTHSNENPYSCDMCMYKCGERSALTKHKRIHSTEKLFVCKYCPYESSVEINLRNHTTVHTGKGRQHSELALHMQTPHTKEKAAQKTHLHRHTLKHTGDKLFQCQLCPYKSTCEAVLIGHMKVHTKEKPYWCQLCAYKCTRKKLLVTHLNTHTSEEPFACIFCGYKSLLRGNLYLHMTVHGGVKPHKCDVCDKKFSNKRCWTRHGVSCLRKHRVNLKESLSAG